jgi:DNA-binding CsgD family transcriptional regulator
LTGLNSKCFSKKTHPGFFTKLKEQVSEITQAEQRMAALTRLHLTTKQMAAVLGIFANSVIKAKQRLRQRFNFETDLHVEELLTKL